MANVTPPRFVRIAAPNRQAAIGIMLRQALGRVEAGLPEALRRLLRRLDPAPRPRPENAELS